ncbi:ankyrin repeats (3 copies) domain-containing protein [Purpureocillium lavendulum]|uniref:Ankyrin repeats (3 copies) domain-containing protein n=1 Tax=Purpureocillium lavendulum TaxID=1247861 RepID=A0AB34G0Y4_9HYPO|nr:ankyrin repeats (3 copies) domain-containing protein [Purpureocillium lavendulum]
MSEEQKPYSIEGWDLSGGSVDMSVLLNGYTFTIDLSAECFVNSPIALQRFEVFFKMLRGELGEIHHPEVREFAEDVADVFLPEFEKLAPPKPHKGKLTLADRVPRGYFRCDYRVVDENPMVGAITKRDKAWPIIAAAHEGCDMRRQSVFPLFDPADVEVPYIDRHSIYDVTPRKVVANGKTVCFKSCFAPYDCIEEVDKHLAIRSAGASAQRLNISRLFGIVADRQGLASGLLYEWIYTKAEETLAAAATVDTPMALREKWVSQLRAAVAGLHDLGFVWGDVKADNVLIDEDDNAILIDLEGGSTDEWVDREIGDTVEGDLQGLERLVDFIFNDDSPWRRQEQRLREAPIALGAGIPIA